MTRRRLALVVCLLLAGSAGAAAGQEKDFTYGPMAGIGLAKAGGSDVGEGNTSFFGTAVGGFITLGATKRFAFEPQLLMIEKGLKAEVEGFSIQTKITYLQLPLLVKARIPLGSFTGLLFAGPAIALKIGCRLNLAEAGNELNAGCEESEDEDSPQISSSELAAIMGVGAEVGRAVIALRYDLGLSRLDASVENRDIKNRAFYLTAGVKMRLSP